MYIEIVVSCRRQHLDLTLSEDRTAYFEVVGIVPAVLPDVYDSRKHSQTSYNLKSSLLVADKPKSDFVGRAGISLRACRSMLGTVGGL
jgi:hypothetical protein